MSKKSQINEYSDSVTLQDIIYHYLPKIRITIDMYSSCTNLTYHMYKRFKSGSKSVMGLKLFALMLPKQVGQSHG